MADINISELPDATNVADTDHLEIERPGDPATSLRATPVYVWNYILGKIFGTVVWTAAAESGGDVTLDTVGGTKLAFYHTAAGTEDILPPTNVPNGTDKAVTVYLDLDPGSETVTFTGFAEPHPDVSERAMIAMVRRHDDTWLAMVAHEQEPA